jgi:hypothetical protein
MKTKTDSLLALAGWLLVSAMFQPLYAQNGRPAQSSGAAERALRAR